MVSVPILLTLSDRIDPKRIYLFGVAATITGHLLFATYADGFWSALITRALTGMGWAGTYMTGLKLLADRVDPQTMSRATASHAASIGISGALSFAVGDQIASAVRLAGRILLCRNDINGCLATHPLRDSAAKPASRTDQSSRCTV